MYLYTPIHHYLYTALIDIIGFAMFNLLDNYFPKKDHAYPWSNAHPIITRKLFHIYKNIVRK